MNYNLEFTNFIYFIVKCQLITFEKIFNLFKVSKKRLRKFDLMIDMNANFFEIIFVP